MTCRGAELTLNQGFADVCVSALWLPPVIQDKVDILTTHLSISVNLLAEMMGHCLEFLVRFYTMTFFPVLSYISAI